MDDEPILRQTLAAFVERRERLSARQRLLLDALVRRGGVDVGQAALRGAAAPDEGARAVEQEGAETPRPAGSGDGRAAGGAGRGAGEPPSLYAQFLSGWRQLLGGTQSTQALGWSEWMPTNLFAALFEQLEHASHLGQPAAAHAPSPSPLIVMRSAGSKIPFFCVHALLGSVFHYHRLASLMDPDQPFYALQAPGLDGTEAPLDSVEAFARCYLQAVREVQPTGPYKLGGYSFGSWIALQMASQLIEDGEKVSFVAILGTDVPLSVSMPLIYEQATFISQYWEAFQRNILEPFLPFEGRMKRALGQDNGGRSSPLWRVVMAHNRAALRFAPKPYPGKLTLFETVDQQLRAPLDVSRGWKRLSREGVETHAVSGNHLNMLDEPHVRDLAEKLTQCLNRS